MGGLTRDSEYLARDGVYSVGKESLPPPGLKGSGGGSYETLEALLHLGGMTETNIQQEWQPAPRRRPPPRGVSLGSELGNIYPDLTLFPPS